jgi:hypothetical protein
MNTYLRICNGVVVTAVTQSELPPDDESGFWIVKPDIFSGPDWLYENGVLRRPDSIAWFLLKGPAFVARFTRAEWEAIQQTASNDADVADCLTYMSSEKISVVSRQTLDAMQTLIAKALITSDRVGELTSPAKGDEAANAVAPEILSPDL